MVDHIPQVFVGTMYCGEGDYDECIRAILNQKGVNVMHAVIANQPEKEAHNRLWHAWRDVQHTGFNMFVKVDADTVLAHDEVLLELWRTMSSNPRITGIQAPLLDFFTESYINGLNCFSPRVTFQDTADTLFCDRQVDVGHDLVVKSGDVNERLRPAGFHCFSSTDKQAFHYGLHRALKGQIQIIDQVTRAWQRNGDHTRSWALAGAACAGTFTDDGFNYNDERFNLAFEASQRRFNTVRFPSFDVRKQP